MTSKKVDQFVHLHTHTHFSILDGHDTIDELVTEVSRLGQPAVAVTDHGSLSGLYDLYNAAKKHDITPIAGCEFYMTPSIGSRKSREPLYLGDGSRDDVSGRGAYTHITILAENNIGLKNLFQLSLKASSEGFYQKPRVDLELLEEHREGLIVTTGCPSGEVQTWLRLGHPDKALEYAAKLQDIFGKENVFMELMEHGMAHDLERGVRAGLLDIAKKLDMPLVATNDLHYATKADCESHEQMLAIQTRAVMSEPAEYNGGRRFAFEGGSYYVKSAEEMASLFPDHPDALKNTLLIAERSSFEVEPDETLRPKLPGIPEGETEASWLRKEAYKGLAKRLPDKVNDTVYVDRLNMELEVLEMKGFSGYFLVVSDFVKWGKFVAQPPVPTGYGRGSAAGSLVAFVMDITDADPIRFDLLFERFINPERDSPPDIDMDFNDTDRERVVEYVKEKYGTEYVAHVATFGKIGAKTAIKDVVRILERPYAVGDALSKALPPAVFGKEIKLSEVYNPNAERYHEAGEFRALVEKEKLDDVITAARKLEGRTRSIGVHAAALVISSRPVVETIPMFMRQNDGAFITQWDYPTAEELGLLKVDFLGLRNLGVISNTIHHIKKTRGVDVDLQSIIQGPMDDPATYKLLQRGDTLGVFQLDGGGMRKLLKQLKPTEFEDISAVLSLYRPGPMGVDAHTDYALRKNGLQDVTPIHPEFKESLADILGPTYQLVVYQEQVQRIAQRIAGYTLAQADLLRRAMGKKKRYIIDAEFVPFSEGAKANGYSDEAIKTLWDILVPFADYAFNKSHTVGYGLISYVTAYLKANYPAEFMSALLSSVADKTDQTALYLNECKHMGITVYPPAVSRSIEDYRPVSETEIYFGLKAIRGMGSSTAEEIVKARGDKPFLSLSDFMHRMPDALINKRVLEGLAQGGGFDDFGIPRKSLISAFPDMLKAVQKARKKASTGMVSLFDDEDDDMLIFDIMDIGEYTKLEKLKLERHALGLYVSDHPLNGLQIDSQSDATVYDLISETIPVAEGGWGRPQKLTKVSGIITSLEKKRTKAGASFAVGTIEDMTGGIPFAMFSKVFEEYGADMKLDGVYQFTGQHRKRSEEDEIQFIIDSVRPLDFGEHGHLNVKVRLTARQWLDGRDKFLKRLERHQIDKGSLIQMSVLDGKEIHDFTLDGVSVKRSPQLIADIRELFGIDAIGRWRSVE